MFLYSCYVYSYSIYIHATQVNKENFAYIYRFAYSEQNITVGHISICSFDTKQVTCMMLCYDREITLQYVMFSIRRQCRKYCRILYNARCLLALVLVVLIVFILFSKHYQLYKKFTENSNLTTKTKSATVSVAGKKLTLQDSYYLVTAIRSREFKWLLKFIAGVILEDEFELIIWSLNLRDCEFNYLRNLKTSFRLHIHRFPYHFHPLHIRSYELTAIKPIVIQSSAVTFGEVIWIEPSGKLPLQIKRLIEILNDKGFVAGSSSKQPQGNCLTDAIGVNFIQYKTFLDSWVECARTNSCIAKIWNKNKAVNGVDVLFEYFRKERKIRCESIKSLDVPSSGLLNHWESNEKELCPLHKACVLTGKHFNIIT